MALSGSTDYTQNAGQLIRAALLKLGVVNPNSTVNEATNNMCLDALNRMIKHWQMQGAHMWTQHEGVLVLDNAVSKYNFSDSSLAGGAVGMVRADAIVVAEIDADEAAAQTVIDIDSTTGMAATDKIIIALDDDTRHVTTIVSVDSATQVTITDALPSAASQYNKVYSYPVAVSQANLFYPSQISNVRVKDADDNERMLTEMSRFEYFARNNTDQAGSPYSYYLEDNLVNKSLFLFPVPDRVSEYVKFTYIKSLDDVDAFTNNIEFPVEWHRAIVLNLAVEVALEFGKEAKLNILLPLAKDALDDALGWDDENVDVQIIPYTNE
jgi:hypothetical protein